jgi:hypothetical protein
MRASWGLKAPAQRERRRAVLELFLLRAEMADWEEGMKESSRREVRYCVRLEEMSFSVW